MSPDVQIAVPTPRPPPKYFTSHQVGDLLQVNPSSIVKWINDGILFAFRTPGGHRRVAADEVVRFARHHGMPVPDELRGIAISQVLVVDDEPRFLSALQRAFKPFDDEISLRTVDNGIDALVLVGEIKPDVVILDLRMPGLNGIEVLQRLRANPTTRNIQVVVVTGESDGAIDARCKELGAVACLQKPVKVPALLETIRDLRRSGLRIR
ncbi:MAG: response regulator [Deltaproteobacteria bacterium]